MEKKEQNFRVSSNLDSATDSWCDPEQDLTSLPLGFFTCKVRLILLTSRTVKKYEDKIMVIYPFTDSTPDDQYL